MPTSPFQHSTLPTHSKNTPPAFHIPSIYGTFRPHHAMHGPHQLTHTPVSLSHAFRYILRWYSGTDTCWRALYATWSNPRVPHDCPYAWLTGLLAYIISWVKSVERVSHLFTLRQRMNDAKSLLLSSKVSHVPCHQSAKKSREWIRLDRKSVSRGIIKILTDLGTILHQWVTNLRIDTFKLNFPFFRTSFVQLSLFNMAFLTAFFWGQENPFFVRTNIL